MVTDIKVNYINRPINRCARVNRSFPHAALSEIGSDSHVHIPFAAMEQIQALAYQEYIIFDHIFSAKAKLTVVKIVQLGIDTESFVNIVSESYAEFPLHSPALTFRP